MLFLLPILHPKYIIFCLHHWKKWTFIYTGPCKPTKSDFERIPLLVRHKKVAAALEWLKLNHQDYFDSQVATTSNHYTQAVACRAIVYNTTSWNDGLSLYLAARHHYHYHINVGLGFHSFLG